MCGRIARVKDIAECAIWALSGELGKIIVDVHADHGFVLVLVLEFVRP
jgi:hypothetical protein